MKKKYFMNGFLMIMKAYSKYGKEYEFIDYFPKPQQFDFITNFLGVKRLVKTKEFSSYDVVHMCTWEGILAYKKKRKDQIFIAHMHGLGPGLSYDITIRELPFIKRQLARILKLLVDNKMKKQIRSADLFYVSTPNMLEHAKKIRKDVKWLPNPIDTKVFDSKGDRIMLEGSPSVFLPSRMHVFKNPLFAVKLFNKIKAKYPGAMLHVVNFGRGTDPLYDEFMLKILDKNAVVEHKRMSRKELTKFYRSADLVLGQFNPNLATLGLTELEAMACGAPIVSLDKYEIKMPLKSLEKLAFNIIEDKKFRNEYVKKCTDLIKKVHSEDAVGKLHRDNLRAIRKRLN